MADTVKPQLQTDFDYLQIPGEDRSFVKQRALSIHETARRTAEGIIRIGQWLTEVKERLEHGQWLPWLKGEFGWSHDTASRFMRVYQAVKLRNLRNLNLDVSALYLIAAPSTPEPVKREVVERAERGEPMTRAKAIEVLQDYQSRVKLPPPAVARQIAIATGEATPASNHTYILPMSKQAEEALTEEITKANALYYAMETLAKTDVTPSEMMRLAEKHACHELRQFALGAATWLQSLLKEIENGRRERTQKAG